MDLIVNTIKTFFEEDYEHFRLVVGEDSITVHNNLSDFNSKRDLEGERLNMHLMMVAFNMDFEINQILNRMADTINEETPFSAHVLSPGNVLSIRPGETEGQAAGQLPPPMPTESPPDPPMKCKLCSEGRYRDSVKPDSCTGEGVWVGTASMVCTHCGHELEDAVP